MKITLAVTTWNDERIIKRFMEHHSSHVDEIILADDCSVDNTRKIVLPYVDKYLFNDKREYNCEFYRQRLADLSSNDWILMMDSDQFVDFDIIDKLRDYINNKKESEEELGYYYFNLETIGHLDCPACPKIVWKQVKLTNRKHIRWSIFPHCGVFNVDKTPVKESIIIGRMWHLMKDYEGGIEQHKKDHIIRMYRWMDVCKLYLQTYTSDFYKLDRERCKNVFKNIKIDIENVKFNCSKDPDKLIWIENDEELWAHLCSLRLFN